MSSQSVMQTAARPSPEDGGDWVGSPIQRLEDHALLTGQGHFVDDLHLPGMLHACFVRSPHAHARIRSIDRQRALALPGVHAVLIWADLPEAARKRVPVLLPNPAIRDPLNYWVLARDEVVYVVREGTPEGGLRVTAYGPGNAQDVHDCPDVTTAGARVLDIERRLFAQGFESDARHAA